MRQSILEDVLQVAEIAHHGIVGRIFIIAKEILEILNESFVYILYGNIPHTLSNFIVRNRAEIQAIIKLVVYSWRTN